jgi:hypothetical protein
LQVNGGMRVALAIEALDEAEGLVAELKAIEQWDARTGETLARKHTKPWRLKLTPRDVAKSCRNCSQHYPATAQQGEKELWTVKKPRPAQERKTGVTHGLSWKPS